MKKNKMMRIASGLLVAVLLTTCAISGTFAKYATKVTATDTAHVAKWDVTIVESGKDTFAFNLFNTIYDTENDNAETDVVADKIAPGTKGQFAIALSAKNEVTTKYTIEYTMTNTAGVPIQFSLDGATWVDDIAELNATDTIAVANAANYTDTVTVYWKWDIGGVDADGNGTDNVYGDGNTSVTVAVTIIFEQVD